MRTRGKAVLAAAAIALAGCGGSGSSGKTNSDPAAGVRATIRAFADDLSAGNYGAACDLFTASARAKLGGSSCASLLAAGMSASSGARKQVQDALRKIDTYPVSVHGDTASTPNVSGGAPTTFVKQSDRWLISGGVSG